MKILFRAQGWINATENVAIARVAAMRSCRIDAERRADSGSVLIGIR